MARKPGVYWDRSWNPATGCAPDEHNVVCRDRCWAAGIAKRLPLAHAGVRVCQECGGDALLGGSECPDCRGTGRVPVPFSRVVLHHDRLGAPLHWKKPRVVAVSWMGDLFHEDVTDEFIDRVFDRIRETPQHIYLVLTKRVERMHRWMWDADQAADTHGLRWPWENLYLGVSVWDQESADRNIPILLDTPAAHRWVSVEPMLGPVDLSDWLGPDPSFDHESGIHQIIAGCENLSGRAGRPMSHEWARSVRDQCAEARAPFYLKQMSEHEDGTGKVVKEPYLDGKQHLELAWEVKR